MRRIFIIAIIYLTFNHLHCVGKSIVALKGRDSVVLAFDMRFASSSGSTFVGTNKKDIYQVGDNCILSYYGYGSDCLKILNDLDESIRDYDLKHIEPNSVSRRISNFMYRGGLKVNPVIAGIDRYHKPFISVLDSDGTCLFPEEFAAIGSSSDTLLSICKSLYSKNLDKDRLLNLALNCFSIAIRRDILSGGGIIKLVLIGRNEINEFEINQKDL